MKHFSLLMMQFLLKTQKIYQSMCHVDIELTAICCFNSFSFIGFRYNIYLLCFSQIVVHEKVMEQIKDVDSLKFEEVDLFLVGMAEVNPYQQQFNMPCFMYTIISAI